MKVFLVAMPADEPALISFLASQGIVATSYNDVWRNGGDSTARQRLSIRSAVESSDAVILDLSDPTMDAMSALALGIAVTVGKKVVTIADADADLQAGRAGLRYSIGDDEAMRLFGASLTEALKKQHTDENEESPAPQVFISYAHADKPYLDRLRVHLRPLQRSFNLGVWSDTDIRPGSSWRDDIAAALDKANIAVLLVSADFLASEFITSNELPPLLKKARSRGAVILPLIVTPCRFTRDAELSVFQAVNDPKEPLAFLSLERREEYYDRVADEIERRVAESGATTVR